MGPGGIRHFPNFRNLTIIVLVASGADSVTPTPPPSPARDEPARTEIDPHTDRVVTSTGRRADGTPFFKLNDFLQIQLDDNDSDDPNEPVRAWQSERDSGAGPSHVDVNQQVFGDNDEITEEEPALTRNGSRSRVRREPGNKLQGTAPSSSKPVSTKKSKSKKSRFGFSSIFSKKNEVAPVTNADPNADAETGQWSGTYDGLNADEGRTGPLPDSNVDLGEETDDEDYEPDEELMQQAMAATKGRVSRRTNLGTISEDVSGEFSNSMTSSGDLIMEPPHFKVQKAGSKKKWYGF